MKRNRLIYYRNDQSSKAKILEALVILLVAAGIFLLIAITLN